MIQIFLGDFYIFFRIDKLSVGIAVFGQSFVMLFTALTVAGDRARSFLVRLYTTPMKAIDFILGYMLPMLVIGAAQGLLIALCSWIVSLCTGVSLQPLGLLASVLTLLPSLVLFISLGLLLGTLFNEKAAPGLCSVIISLASFLGCIWFDADSLGGVMLTICRALPFYYCTRAGRSAAVLAFSREGWLLPLLIVAGCAALMTLLASWVFRTRMKAD